MSKIGKGIRIERILDRKTRRTVIVPMDHGITVGPITGLIDLPATVNKVAEGGANAVLGHMGLPIHGHRGYGRDVGLIIHLSASTSLGPDPNHKVLVTSVEDAMRIGADAVSIHVGDSLVRIEAAWLAVLVGHRIGLDHTLASADCANPADAALAIADYVLLDYEALLAVFAFHYPRRTIAKSGIDIVIPKIERLENVAVGIDDIISSSHCSAPLRVSALHT